MSRAWEVRCAESGCAVYVSGAAESRTRVGEGERAMLNMEDEDSATVSESETAW